MACTVHAPESHGVCLLGVSAGNDSADKQGYGKGTDDEFHWIVLFGEEVVEAPGICPSIGLHFSNFPSRSCARITNVTGRQPSSRFPQADGALDPFQRA